MSDPSFQRLRELVSSALELPAGEREAFLRRECSEPELLEQALALLEFGENSQLQLTRAVGRQVQSAAAEIVAGEGQPERIGDYRILDTLGSGGMGVVYRAAQTGALERQVALKLIRPGFDSERIVARFESERRVLARMDHPNIAQVFEAGTTTQGSPWFAMEFVDGQPLHAWCDARELSIARRLELFVQVCRGVQHAHQKGIIHRDLKPANVLITAREGGATVKIIDFGIAKALEEEGESAVTLAGQLVGTPEYMSPERLAGREEDVDTRSDIYSLGVLLYELLCGSLPFDRSALRRTGISGDALQAEARRPSTQLSEAMDTAAIARCRDSQPQELKRQLRGDLDWIALKALSPEPADRYATVQGLLNDIERHLAAEPVLARPPTLGYRLGRYARRHRGLLASVAIVISALAVGLIESNRQRLRATSALAQADQVTAFLTEMMASVRPDEMGRNVTVRAVLDQASASLDTDLEQRPLVRATLATAIGRSYLALGLHHQAETQLDKALAIRRARLGNRDPATLDTRYHLATVYRERDEFDHAIEEFEQILALREEILGPLHETTLGTLASLGSTYNRRGDVAAAKQALQNAHDGFLATKGPEDLDTLHNAGALGNLLAEQGEIEAAAPFLEDAFATLLRVYGEKSPDTISAMNNLALLRMDQGNPVACESLLTRVVALREEVHGVEHPEYLMGAVNLGSLRSQIGQLEEACAILSAMLPASQRTLGDDHQVTLTCMNNLAWAYDKLGRHDEAEPLWVKTLEIRRRVLGEDHLFTLITANNLGEHREQTGNFVESERIHRDVLARRRRTLGDDHPHGMISMTNLANALRGQRRFEEAEALYLESYRLQSEKLGAKHGDARITAEQLSKCYELWGRAADAAAWAARAGS